MIKNILKPWEAHYHWAKYRCNNYRSPLYPKYGGKGIKCYLTIDEVRRLWFRDEAFKLKIPVLDRRDNNGNYHYNNCQFIESIDNLHKEYAPERLKILKKILQCLLFLQEERSPYDTFQFTYSDLMRISKWKYDKTKKWVKHLFDLGFFKLIDGNTGCRGKVAYYQIANEDDDIIAIMNSLHLNTDLG